MKVIEVAASTTPGPWQKVYSGDVWGMVFDGTYWWTTEGESRTVTQRDTTWTSLSTFTTDYVIDRTRGITFDGTDLWVTGDSGGSNDAAKRYSTAGVKQSQFITGGLSTLGIAWDGTDLWVVDSDNLQLAKYDTAGSLIDTVSIPGTRHGLSVHGGRLYVVDMSAATVEIREADGTLVQTIDTSPVTSSPTGVWATSGTLYVAEDNVGVWKRAL